METEKSTKQSMWSQWSSPPNLVTLARIVLVVVFLGLYIGGGAWGARNIGMRWGAAIVFIIAASTDKIDGWMARKYNQVTELGKLLDPIADKLLTLGALVVAACFNEFGNMWIGWIVTGLYVVREIGITIMRFFVIDHGGKVIAASQAGKYKTFTLCLGLGLLLMPVWSLTHAVSQPAWLTVYFIVAYALIYFSLILCLYSGYEYLRGVFAKPAVTRK
ncbi:MAG: CDP-diacylglycerol--glycerol-3-phosphate 3-phosphatidyltransferase [Bifidobacterium animalis]|uniref:CDP-diacylglycerol--glycerol-3-phosphate 3-phosphatidyltransferase n=1 Tax=Bifidobacterium animalis TaxID=28025 RepID=UPI001021C704|nr:CDP-diacylglycerol--glycerol-3-phosphate 3-phosphatidyltransferase [Bifidobacterium animalis]MCI6531400.1 CDP-diacylglycerol--glycerol-3-phosphate 3-phosphatidyltransferase [Bifidobacterium animalis]MDY5040650.1 CDP-diacylglycerol--glycerol-3-phosphate 3-phosphatidyltransferase [Bifidobacterium animalis]RYN12727.1 CDP-diacylglycerol--glycerol-3-phosphate 3-phosphatidyltransferase [Bifidobacterium animalis subsp. animalis]RYN13289.1 CDP-diacylglycerol--glycerol-3-phosphate 3-phosphatidyltrans